MQAWFGRIAALLGMQDRSDARPPGRWRPGDGPLVPLVHQQRALLDEQILLVAFLALAALAGHAHGAWSGEDVPSTVVGMFFAPVMGVFALLHASRFAVRRGRSLPAAAAASVDPAAPPARGERLGHVVVGGALGLVLLLGGSPSVRSAALAGSAALVVHVLGTFLGTTALRRWEQERGRQLLVRAGAWSGGRVYLRDRPADG